MNNRKTCTLTACIALCCILAFQDSYADLTIDITSIQNQGNTADDTGHGSVGYSYAIGTYETTVAQYTEFLNAVAQNDPHDLYNSYMSGGTSEGPFITRTGSEGDYAYSTVAGTGNQPVRWVSFYDGMRFCNWLGNGQGSGDTESGSYNLSLGAYAVRESGATWVIPSQDEWYKATYYDPDTGTYYDYPNGTDDAPSEPTDGTTTRVMNFGDDPYWAPDGPWIYYTDVGETTGQSPYGTFDQGGGIDEWTDSFSTPDYRVMLGGNFLSHADELSSSDSSAYTPDTEGAGFGFRVAFMVPEPSTVMLLFLGGLSCLFFRRR